MKTAKERLFHAAQLRSLRGKLGLNQEQMGSCVGVSREWIGKLERAQEDFSEFVLLKMGALEQIAARVGPDATPEQIEKALKSAITSPDGLFVVPGNHDVREGHQAPYGSPEMLEMEIRRDLETLIVGAKKDPNRLGWIAEQMRAHLAMPKHWMTNEELNQRARELARLSRGEVDHGRPVSRPQPGGTEQTA